MTNIVLVFQIILMILKVRSNPPNHVYNVTELLESITCDQKVPDLTQYFNSEAILGRTKKCPSYFDLIPSQRLSHKINKRDSTFPLAFSHTILDRVNLLEVFLMVHFRSSDVHCIHVALNAPEIVFRAVQSLVACYQHKYSSTQIFLTKKRIPAILRHSSYLDSHVLCLDMLLKLQYDWKMWVHVSPGDFPLRSIDELRYNLKFLNKTLIDVRINEHPNRQGRLYGFDILSHQTRQIQKRVISSAPMEPPCHFVIAEGDPCVALLKSDVQVLLGTTVPLHLFHWFRCSDVPEQHFFATWATIKIIRWEHTGQALAPIVFELKQTITPNMMSSDHECVRKYEWYQGYRQERSESGVPEEDHFRLYRLCFKTDDTCLTRELGLETLKMTEPASKFPFADMDICLRKRIIAKNGCEDTEFKRGCRVQLKHLPELKRSQCFFGNYFDTQNLASKALACQLKSLLNQ